MFYCNYTPIALPLNNFYLPFSGLNLPNYTFPMPNLWSGMFTPNTNYLPFTGSASIWNNPLRTSSLINPVRRNNTVSQSSLINPRQNPVTINDTDNGQKMIDYAKQFAGKTQNEMRQIMEGQHYAFHTNLWCADFVSFITGKALGEENLPEWYKKCNRAYVPDIENQARKNGAIVAERHGNTIDTSNVRPGHYVIINWERDDREVDHIGYVLKIEGNKVYTIEGNAGGKVSYNTRDISLVHSFVEIG